MPRGPGRPFEKGKSGNPGGRPKGLARLAREATTEGKDIIDFWKDVLQDETARMSDRIEASRLLAERGFGKAPIHASVEGGDPLELSDVDAEINTLVDELAGRREAAAAKQTPKRAVARNGKASAASS